jgi:hypothetical protein
MMRKLLACLATLVVVLSLSGPSKAQTPTGTIQGAVQDASGALVPDVKIRVININTNEARELRTDSAGRYVQPYLLPGMYSVMAEKTGFQSVRLDSIKLDVGQNRSVNLALDVGAITQEVKVEAAPPPVDLNTSAVGQIVENKRIMDLPLNGRSALSLSAPSLRV